MKNREGHAVSNERTVLSFFLVAMLAACTPGKSAESSAGQYCAERSYAGSEKIHQTYWWANKSVYTVAPLADCGKYADNPGILEAEIKALTGILATKNPKLQVEKVIRH